MPRMPSYEEIRDDFARGVRTAEQHIEHPFRHPSETAPAGPAQGAEPYPQAPAAQPVNLAAATAAAPSKENTMSPITTLEDDVKADLTDGLNWMEGFVTRVKAAAPGIIATSEAIGGTTVSKLVEAAAGAVLPPAYEQVAVDFVKDLITKYGQPAQAPAAPAGAPAQ
jgi:hypothetical protein